MHYVPKVLIIAFSLVSHASIAVMKGFEKSEAPKMEKEIKDCLNFWEISQHCRFQKL